MKNLLKSYPFHSPWKFWGLPLFLLLTIGILAFRFSPHYHKKIEVTLNEGTNMAATLSPNKKEIAIDNLGRIWILPVEGGKAKPLTDPFGDARQPTWSPDGKRIAFQAYWEGNWHIYTIDKEGKNLEQITQGLFDHREPHWSPDGKSLAFSSDRSGNYDIWTKDLSNNTYTQITQGKIEEYAPAWSPDGEQLAFLTQTGYIFSLSARKKKLDQIGKRKGKLAGLVWAPDGNSLYFNELTGNQSKLIKLDLSNRSPTFQHISLEQEDIFPFRVSFFSNEDVLYTSDGKIKRKTPNGENPQEIDFSLTVGLERHVYRKRKRDFDHTSPQTAKGIVSPSLSPKHKEFAFIALNDLWIQNLNGDLAQITTNPFVEISPTWHPSGDELAYISDIDGAFAIWLWNKRSGVKKKLVQVPGSPSGIAWSPDGNFIAYTANFGPRMGQLWKYHIDTQTFAKVGNNQVSSIGGPTISPNGKIIAFTVLDKYSKLYREGINRIQFVTADGNKTWKQKSPRQWSIGARMDDGPIWSPDGKWITYIAHGQLWKSAVDEWGQFIDEPIRLTNELADAPSWSSDSKYVLFKAADKMKMIDVLGGEITEVPVELTWKRKLPKGKKVIRVKGIFDGILPEIHNNKEILLDGHRIVAINDAGDERNDVNTQVINAEELYALPGLIDIHSHQGSWDGEKLGRTWLAWGVTSTRDPATEAYDVVNRKEAHEAGLYPGPRIFFTGSPIDGNRVYYGGTYAQQSPAQIDLELGRAKALGYDMVKTYVRLPNPLQEYVVRRAHDLGMHVSSHELYPAVAYGADGVEHILGTSRRGYSPKMTETFKSYSDVTTMLGVSGMTFTPTIGIYVSFPYLLEKDTTILSDPRIETFVDPFMVANIRSQIAQVRSNPKLWQTNFRHASKMITDIHEKGGIITAGTDGPILPFGMGLHLELEAYVEAGMSVFDVLRSATINNAKTLGVAEDLGTIEAGKLADMILVKKNPLEDIKHIREIVYVIQNGTVYTLQELLQK